MGARRDGDGDETSAIVAGFARAVELTRDSLSDRDPWLGLLTAARWIGVTTDDVWLLTEPVDGFAARPEAELWAGPADPAARRANTAVDLDSGRWAMVELPVPVDDDEAVRLLVHEAWHAFGQPVVCGGIVADERAAAGHGHLETAEGRTWLRMTAAALAAAIRADGPRECRRYAADAVALEGGLRTAAQAGEVRRESVLEITEGIAEYVSRLATDHDPDELAAYVTGLDPDVSWMRSAAYRTGVGWCALLDRLAPGRWRVDLAEVGDLVALVRREAGICSEPVRNIAKRYGGAVIAAEEQNAARTRTQRWAELRARFVAVPVLSVAITDGMITFDPEHAVPVPEGTVYVPFGWAAGAGAVAHSAAGALVSTDWSSFDLPLPTDPGGQLVPPTVERGAQTVVTGPGFRLRLPLDWELVRADDGWRAAPPA